MRRSSPAALCPLLDVSAGQIRACTPAHMGATTASQHEPNVLTPGPNGVVRPLGLRQSRPNRAGARRKDPYEGAIPLWPRRACRPITGQKIRSDPELERHVCRRLAGKQCH